MIPKTPPGATPDKPREVPPSGRTYLTDVIAGATLADWSRKVAEEAEKQAQIAEEVEED